MPKKSLTEEFFSLALDDAYSLVDRCIRSTLLRFDLTKSEYTLLRVIENHAGIQASEAKMKMKITGPSTSALVQSLEKKGMILRIPDPDDGRKLALHLTERAENILEKIRSMFRELLLKAKIDAPTLSSLTRSLTFLTSSLLPHVS